jgi:hypothetical protein
MRLGNVLVEFKNMQISLFFGGWASLGNRDFLVAFGHAQVPEFVSTSFAMPPSLGGVAQAFKGSEFQTAPLPAFSMPFPEDAFPSRSSACSSAPLKVARLCPTLVR